MDQDRELARTPNKLPRSHSKLSQGSYLGQGDSLPTLFQKTDDFTSFYLSFTFTRILRSLFLATLAAYPHSPSLSLPLPPLTPDVTIPPAPHFLRYRLAISPALHQQQRQLKNIRLERQFPKPEISVSYQA
jgi:hypothetical protein